MKQQKILKCIFHGRQHSLAALNACRMPHCPTVPGEMFVCLSVEKCIKMRSMQMQNAECIPHCHGQHLHLSNNNKLHIAWPAATAATPTHRLPTLGSCWGGSSQGRNSSNNNFWNVSATSLASHFAAVIFGRHVARGMWHVASSRRGSSALFTNLPGSYNQLPYRKCILTPNAARYTLKR